MCALQQTRHLVHGPRDLTNKRYKLWAQCLRRIFLIRRTFLINDFTDWQRDGVASGHFHATLIIEDRSKQYRLECCCGQAEHGVVRVDPIAHIVLMGSLKLKYILGNALIQTIRLGFHQQQYGRAKHNSHVDVAMILLADDSLLRAGLQIFACLFAQYIRHRVHNVVDELADCHTEFTINLMCGAIGV
jgi:hypothetical protein